MVFIDTSAWFAWFVPTDRHHAQVADWLSANRQPLVTSDYCIDETLTLLVARKRLSRALDAGRAFFHENLTQIQFLTEGQIQRAWIVFQQRAAAGWSFTDCATKIVVDDLKIRTVATLDDHLRQLGSLAIAP